MNKCEHYIDCDDENFLLDDENAREEKCVRCRKHETIWTNGDVKAHKNWKENIASVFVNDGSEHIMSTIIDDHADNLEDSPLLINDCYRETEKEFHCHNSVVNSQDASVWKKLIIASILCCVFMVAEVLGGYFAGSLAIMTDAAHLFSDFVGFMISLLAIWVGRKPPTKRMTFGYHRAEVIGALLSVLTIWVLGAVFCVLAIDRLYNDNYEIDADTMIIVATLGLIVNIILGFVLHGTCSKSHSHGPGQQHGHSSNDNINVRAAAIHVLGDLLQSFGVLIAALVIKFFPEAKIADPICTLLFSVIVVCTTLKIGRDSLWYLIEGSPMNSIKLVTELGRLNSVKHVHNTHIWSLAPGKDAVAVHLAVDRYCDRDLLLQKATSIIQSQISFISCTIQIEPYNSELVTACQQCQSLQS